MSDIGDYLRSRFDGGSDDKVRYDLAGAAGGAGLALLGADAMESSQMSRDRRRAMSRLPELEAEATRTMNAANEAADHKAWSTAQSLDDVGGDAKKYQLGKMYKELQHQMEFNDSPELRKQLAELVQHMKDEGVTTYDGPLASGLRQLTDAQQHDLNVLRAGYGLFDDAPVHDIAQETLNKARMAQDEVHAVKNLYKPGLMDYIPTPKKMLNRGVAGAVPYVTIGGALGLGAANYLKDYAAFKEDKMNKEAQEFHAELEKEAANILSGVKNFFKPLGQKIKSLKPEKPPVAQAGQNASQTASQAVEQAPPTPPAPPAPSPNPGPSLGKRMKRGALLVGAGGVGGYALSAGQSAYQQGAMEQQQLQQNKMASTGGNNVNIQDQLEKIAGDYVNMLGFQNAKGKEVSKENKELAKQTGAPKYFNQRKAVREMDQGYDQTNLGQMKDDFKRSFSARNVGENMIAAPLVGSALGAGVALAGNKLTHGRIPFGAAAGAGVGGTAGMYAGAIRSGNASADAQFADMADRNEAMRRHLAAQGGADKEAGSFEDELEKIAGEKIAGVMGNLTGSTVRGMKKNIAKVEEAGADSGLLKKQLAGAQKDSAKTRLGAGLLASGVSGAGAVAGAKKHKDAVDAEKEAEKTASSFGEEAEKDKKDRPSTDKASEKDKDNKKDPENDIKKEKEDAEERTYSDVDKEGFVSKEASESVDFMNALFKEAASTVSSEVMEKVASHQDALSRITLDTFNYGGLKR